MIAAYLDELVARTEATLRKRARGYRARKHLTLELARLAARLFSRQGPTAWCGLLAPFDLLHAMGVTSCFVEFVGGVLAAGGLAGPLLAEAEQSGYSTDGCGYHRAVTGAALQGLMPDPDFLIASSIPCSGGLAVIENLARHFRKDLFVLHIPRHRQDGAIAYLADQLRAMADFVAAHTGAALDPARLREAVERSNRMRALMVEVYELARAVPSPARRRELSNFGVLMSLLAGTEAGVRVAGTYREEFAHRVAAGISGLPGEQLRLMWLQNPIQFHNPLDDIIEREHRAAVVVEELNAVTWEPIDPEDPYPGMARRALSVPMTGEVGWRVEHLRRLAREYRVDGAVNPCHWGCRQGSGTRGLVERGLADAGIPVLNLEVDCVDERNFALGQLRTRVEAFVEMLLSRRAAVAGAAAAP